MKRTAIGLVALSVAFVGSEISAKELPATEIEKSEAAKLHTLCLLVKAEDIDDGISDASVVGKAVSAACVQERQIAIDVFARGQNKRIKQNFSRIMEERSVDSGAEAVLAVRAKRRKSL